MSAPLDPRTAALLVALKPWRTYLAGLPRDTVDDALSVAESIAYALELIADDVEGTDIEGRLRDFVSDETHTVAITRERMAEDEANARANRRAA